MALSLTALIGIVGIAAYWRTKCWSHPAVIFCLFWCIVTMAPILFVPSMTVSTTAVAFLTAASICFAAPAFVIHAPKKEAAARGIPTQFSGNRFALTAIVTQLLPIGMALLNIQEQGISLSEAIFDPIQTACIYLSARYNGLISPTIYSQIGTLINYVGGPLCGIVLASRRDWALRSLVFVVAYIPSIIAVMVYNDKGTVFLTTAYLIGGSIVGRMAAGKTSLVTRDTIIAIVVGMIIIVPMLGIALLNRGGDCKDDKRTAEIFSTFAKSAGARKSGSSFVADSIGVDPSKAMAIGLPFYVRSYAFSHMFAFSDWFDDRLFGTGKLPYMQEPRPTWGFWTFMAIGKRLEPSKHVPEGYYAEYFAEPGVLQSNIYTMYRGLIYDFTIPGALAFMAFLGTLSAYAYRRMLQSAHAPFSQAFYIALAGFTYSSYLLSLGTWLSVYVAGGCVALVLMVMPWITQRVIRRRIANEQ